MFRSNVAGLFLLCPPPYIRRHLLALASRIWPPSFPSPCEPRSGFRTGGDAGESNPSHHFQSLCGQFTVVGLVLLTFFSYFRSSDMKVNSSPSGPLINRVKYFRIQFRFHRDIRSQSQKNSTQRCTLRCALHRGVKILGLANPKKFLEIFSLMIGVFTHKMISPDCPIKSNQRLPKILILTLRCAF